MQISEMRVSEAIGRTLVERGVEVCFGLAGSGNFAVLNALHAAGAAFYSSRHECGAVAMADGYARERQGRRRERPPGPGLHQHPHRPHGGCQVPYVAARPRRGHTPWYLMVQLQD